jgi:two-component system phosphate regulon sensor histidine kinase PhoR
MMATPLAFALILLALLAVWLAWRYFDLVRALRQYAKTVREHGEAPPANSSRLQDLSSSVRVLAEDFRRQLLVLGEERDRLAAVLDQMTDGVLIADASGQVRFSNPAASRIFDVPEPLGRTVTQILRDHQLVAAWNHSRQTNQLQVEAVEISSRHQFLQLIVMPDLHAGGSLILVQDLTRVRRLETVRRDFVSNISHELRTPLASLKALTETLQGGAIGDPAAGPRFLERIGAEVDALTQMSQELMDLSRIESGQVQLDLQPISPRQLLQSAADRMKMQSERGGVAVQLDCAEDLPNVRADASRLEQVLVNLIHNGIKFTRPGGQLVLSAQVVPHGEAQGPEARSASGHVQFSIKDTGIGIPADDVPRIFERFYRVEKSRTGGGTGLGLSIARHIVEAHGGRIWVESVQGQGSNFLFTLSIA